jgi:uncharacterized RDD family membrane protein YckC
MKPGVGIRILSMFLDHVFMCVILVTPVVLFMLLTDFGNPSSPDGLGGGLQIIMLGLMFIYFLKDSFQGRSLAKRLLKLQVVDNKLNTTATFGQCLARNILIIIWPVEVLVTLFSPQRRLGDFLAGTKVVTIDEAMLIHETTR